MEHPLVHTRAHTAALTRPIAAALGAVAILAFTVAVLARTGRPGLSGQVAATITAGLAIFALARLVREVWAWDRTMLLVSEDELVIRRGGLPQVGVDRAAAGDPPAPRAALAARPPARLRHHRAGRCAEGQPAEVRAAAGRGLGGDQHLCWPP